jgi:[ribosomal protein S5]-alanine N-acetyltransferase
MSAPAMIETERLRLRPLTMDDAPTVQELAGRREIAAMTLSIPHPYSLEQAQDWLAKRLAAGGEGNDAVFGIVLGNTGQLIGTVGLREIDADHSRAEMGFWVGVEWWGQGYATEAAQAVLRYGFEHLKLNRVYAHHMTKNPASGRVLEKIGMRQEAVLRQTLQKAGVREDDALWAILRQNWTG